MKVFFASSLFFASLVIPAQAECERPWIFFDLGDTLVDTRVGTSIHYFEGTQDYLESVKALGFSLGLIVNIPEQWGATQEEKLQHLKSFLGEGWDSDASPFQWEDFEVVLLPPDDERRKPHPHLFQMAKEQAGDCAVVYQGESQNEVTVAEAEGMIGYVVHRTDQPFYLPLEELEEIARALGN